MELLGYLKAMNGVHRDLDPRHFLLSVNGVLVIDFGFAAPLGTPQAKRFAGGFSPFFYWSVELMTNRIIALCSSTSVEAGGH